MAGSVNKVILVGNVGKDPEIRNTQAGAKIANLSIATSESWTDKQSGEKRDRTEWHRVVCYNERVADIISRYVHKGSKVYVEGSLQTRKWQDQAGTDRYSTEVAITQFRGDLVLLGDSPERRGERAGAPAPASTYGAPAGGAARGSAAARPNDRDLDDEIPF